MSRVFFFIIRNKCGGQLESFSLLQKTGCSQINISNKKSTNDQHKLKNNIVTIVLQLQFKANKPKKKKKNKQTNKQTNNKRTKKPRRYLIYCVRNVSKIAAFIKNAQIKKDWKAKIM